MNRDFVCKRISQCPEFLEEAAVWFSEKWKISPEEYCESMKKSIRQASGIPQWYLVFENGKLIAGAGVIDNDFHDRVDLTPNLCALYVEKSHRHRGIARQILDTVRADMGKLGLNQIYLITDHEDFYERCGWGFLTMVNDENGNPVRMYVAPTQK